MDNVSLDTLESCDIEITNTAGKTIPIKDQVLSLSIYESIFQPLITCEIALTDAIAIAQDLPIIGEEILTIRLKSTNSSEESTYQFILHGLDDVVNDPNNRHQVYSITGTSVESLADAKVSVQKGYTDTYEAMVNDILTSFIGTSKKVTTGSAKGIHQIIIPNLNPLKAIDFIRQRSVSNMHGYSPFLFYETSRGFYYTDVVSRFSEARSENAEAITKIFYPNYTDGLNETTDDTWKNIVSFETVSKHDTLIKTHNGAFYNNLNKFDLFKKQFDELETKLSDFKDSFDLVEAGEFNTSDMIGDMSQTGATNYMVFVDGSRSDSHIDFIGQKNTFATLLFQTIVNAEFHGDTTMEAGKVIYLDIKKPTGLTGDEPDQEDTRQSGFYMVSKLAHHVTFVGEPSLRTSCELVKGANKSIKGNM
jgi:hypothetical protein